MLQDVSVQGAAAPIDEVADARLLAAAPRPAAGIGDDAPESDGASLPIHGSLVGRYRARSSGDAHDQDLYGTLILDVGDERVHKLTGHVMARLDADLDGIHDADSQGTFPSLSDTSGDTLHGLLYEAYVDVERPGPLAELRIGRQVDYLTPEFAFFDGVRLASKPTRRWRASGGLYGGVPTRLWDTSTSGDALFGAWGEARPWKNGRVRLDWMHMQDERRLGEYDDDLIGLSAWQQVGEALRLDGQYTRLEERDRDVRLRASWDDGRRDLSVQASWYRLLETQRDFASEVDPFFSSLQDYFPFDQWRVMVSKGLAERARVEGGLDVRRVTDGGDVGAFNHDFERGWLSLVLLDVFVPDLTLTVTGDSWNSDDQDTETWGLDLGRKWTNGYELSGGSSYALYKYDLLLDRERDDVRVWYLKLRKKQGKEWTFDARYDYEDEDDDQYQVLTLGATWRF